MYGVMIWVRDGLATIPTTLIIHSRYIGQVDQYMPWSWASYLLLSNYTVIILACLSRYLDILPIHSRILISQTLSSRLWILLRINFLFNAFSWISKTLILFYICHTFTILFSLFSILSPFIPLLLRWLHDSPVLVRSNSLGTWWSHDHNDYSYYSLSLCWIDESMCLFTLR